MARQPLTKPPRNSSAKDDSAAGQPTKFRAPAPGLPRELKDEDIRRAVEELFRSRASHLQTT
jgi:hypothetical protein